MEDDNKKETPEENPPDSTESVGQPAVPESEPKEDGPAEAKSPSEGEDADPGKPARPAARAKPAGASGEPDPEKPAKPPVVKKPPPPRKPVVRGPTYEDLEGNALLEALKERFGKAILSAQSFLDQPIYTVELDVLYEVMLFLRDTPEWNFDYLVDISALDYLGDEKRFCLVYHLYAYPEGPLIRLKSRLSSQDVAPSMCSIWKTADWLEREVYDMFGIEFSGHPDLKRILLPEDWHGHPLRKDYDIKLQDQSWIREHLKIRKIPG